MIANDIVPWGAVRRKQRKLMNRISLSRTTLQVQGDLAIGDACVCCVCVCVCVREREREGEGETVCVCLDI